MVGKILLWLLVNAVLPIVIPALFLAMVAWIKDGTFPIVPICIQLLQKGFYVFSALALVFSLYEEYGMVKLCVGPLTQTWLVMMAFATLIMFYMMRQDEPESYMAKNLPQFIIIWCLTAISATVIKYRIINKKEELSS